jgi:hypothetical protein
MERDVIRELVDKEEIRELLQHYCFLIDTKQPDRIPEEVYTEDGVDVHAEDTDPPLAVSGWADMRAFFRRQLSQFDGTQHAISNHHIELDGDVAHSRVYVIAFHWMPQSEYSGAQRPADCVLSLAYDDDLRRTDRGWRIAHRRLHAFGPGSSLAVGWLPKNMWPGIGSNLYSSTST